MSILAIGLLYGAATLLVMMSGMSIAFALGAVALTFMYFFMPASSLDTVTQNVYEELASITLLSIPLFILKGAAIGSAGIPEMRSRGYSGGFAAEQSLGRLFLAGIGPGVLLVVLFSLYATWRYRVEYRAAEATHAAAGVKSAYLGQHVYSLREKVEMLPRVLPFVILLIGVMVALYGGYATPSETAGLGAILALVLIAVVYGLWRPSQLAPILTSTLRERPC
jgi:C4-dicarboxylate transporter DctM subunit